MALRLDSAKARARLGWQPLLPLDRAIAMTAEWYLGWRRGEDARRLSDHQLDTALALAAQRG